MFDLEWKADCAHKCAMCDPSIVKELNKENPHYYDRVKVQRLFRVLLDGEDVGYTNGVLTGKKGWVLFAGKVPTDFCFHKHNDGTEGVYVCLTPMYGQVEIVWTDAEHGNI